MQPRSMALVALLCASLAIFPSVPAPGPVQYVAGGTLVEKQGGQPPDVDDGVVVCKTAQAAGLGGGCMPFSAQKSILVTDDVGGTNIAFQVCIDNNGDGLCGGENADRNCQDDLFFSHSDNGAFYNPLGPLPTGFRTGCAGGPWQGYVVFLCTGAHVPTKPVGAAHGHVATHGTITSVASGTGYGDFCQPHGFQTKAYRVA